uniref:calcium-translocating P-type ATPase, PMCA-type n=1 Tax=Candidatus Ventrenecus sp. TaxID=3085654 RepID=UPI003FF0C8D9
MDIKGLNKKEVEVQRKLNGSNVLTEKKQKSFMRLLLESLGDPIIKILLVALAIKVVFLFRDFDWFETLGILIAIFLASFISTISEYGSEEAFKKLQEEQESIEVKAKRNGKITKIKLEEVVTKDIIFLSSGDKVPADGFLVSGKISVDESRLNGETKEHLKDANTKDNDVLRGTVVYDGEAYMEVSAVGDKTVYGNLAKELQEEEPMSPLKLRLQGFAKTISKIGYIGAFLVTCSYLFSVIVLDNHFDGKAILNTITNVHLMADYLIYSLTLSVTIIVVAVPEGLPMMITLVLSSNMKRMLKNNVLVRKLVGIETTGSLNILFTDKTGTLTKGKLEVMQIISNEEAFDKESKLKKYPRYYEILAQNLILNNQSIYSDDVIIGGNATDRALLSFLKPQTFACEIMKHTYFNSTNKYSAVTIKDKGIKRTFLKGASEVLLPKCHRYLKLNGEEKPFITKNEIEQTIKNLTSKGCRVLTLAMGHDEDESYLTFLGLVVLKDDLREEALKGVELIQNAGIQVVMITGDAKDTATSIAKEVGIIKDSSDIVLTSTELNYYSDEQIKEILPRLRVVARALPQDKSRLVKLSLEQNFVVGMTGDGVNDAPALKKANVGFAMGSGTEVAKEASDIVILDDNILSISQAILYGRTIFKSIRKFIIYQLTCNFCALFLSIIGPFIGVNTPITIIQMLWINMIMDTFA